MKKMTQCLVVDRTTGGTLDITGKRIASKRKIWLCIRNPQFQHCAQLCFRVQHSWRCSYWFSATKWILCRGGFVVAKFHQSPLSSGKASHFIGGMKWQRFTRWGVICGKLTRNAYWLFLNWELILLQLQGSEFKNKRQVAQQKYQSIQIQVVVDLYICSSWAGWSGDSLQSKRSLHWLLRSGRMCWRRIIPELFYFLCTCIFFC